MGDLSLTELMGMRLPGTSEEAGEPCLGSLWQAVQGPGFVKSPVNPYLELPTLPQSGSCTWAVPHLVGNTGPRQEAILLFFGLCLAGLCLWHVAECRETQVFIRTRDMARLLLQPLADTVGGTRP